MTLKLNTGNDVYSGDRFLGNDRFRGPKPPDDAILFIAESPLNRTVWRF